MKKTFPFLLILLTSIPVNAQENSIRSILEVYDIVSDERQIVLEENAHFEAPNWSTDGSYLIINQKGLLYRISVDGKSKEQIQTGKLKKLNNDHGISFDGKTLAVSNNDAIEEATSGSSRIYTLPITGGKPRLVTPLYPSYWHGWSPDGKYLVYTANRNGNFDIYRIPAEGGEEKRLTDHPGLDDGPEYSPDGKYIYYNAMRSGKMEIWRMDSQGNHKEQLTDDPYSNWFAHPSPDGNHFVFISYLEDQGDSHPPMKKVALRLYKLADGTIKTLCTFTGGQGTINVPSWSPDGKKFAFVSYEGVGSGSSGRQLSFDFSFDHFAIVVDDVDKSAEFYKKVLNLEETPHPDKKAGYRWFLIDGNTQIHLIQKEFASFEKNKSMHLALTTQDLDGLIVHLKAQNVIFDDWTGKKNTVKHRSDGVDQIYIQDPDGYWIEINTVVH